MPLCVNATSLPLASNFADFGFVSRPPMVTLLPGQKYTCVYKVFHLRVNPATFDRFTRDFCVP